MRPEAAASAAAAGRVNTSTAVSPEHVATSTGQATSAVAEQPLESPGHITLQIADAGAPPPQQTLSRATAAPESRSAGGLFSWMWNLGATNNHEHPNFHQASVSQATAAAAVGPAQSTLDDSSSPTVAPASSSACVNTLARRSTGLAAPTCRICLADTDTADLISPCSCAGSVGHVHYACLKAWVAEKGSLQCELCGTVYDTSFQSRLEPALLQVVESGQAARRQRQAAQARGTAPAGQMLPFVADGPTDSCWTLFMETPWYHKLLWVAVYLCLVAGAFLATTWFVGWPHSALDAAMRTVFLAVSIFFIMVCFRHIRRSCLLCCCGRRQGTALEDPMNAITSTQAAQMAAMRAAHAGPVTG